jgi:hypothetical protein
MAVLTYWRTESGIVDRGGSCAGRRAAKRRSAQTRTHAWCRNAIKLVLPSEMAQPV